MTATYKTIGGSQVNIPNIDVHVSLPELKDVLQQAINPPKIDVHVPEQEPVTPVVHVHVPEYPKPEVHVQAPSVQVSSPQNVVNVQVPEQLPPSVLINPQEIKILPTIAVSIQPIVTQKALISAIVGAYFLLLVMIILMFTAHPLFSWLHR